MRSGEEVDERAIFDDDDEIGQDMSSERSLSD